MEFSFSKTGKEIRKLESDVLLYILDIAIPIREFGTSELMKSLTLNEHNIFTSEIEPAFLLLLES